MFIARTPSRTALAGAAGSPIVRSAHQEAAPVVHISTGDSVEETAWRRVPAV